MLATLCWRSRTGERLLGPQLAPHAADFVVLQKLLAVAQALFPLLASSSAQLARADPPTWDTATSSAALRSCARRCR